MRARRARARRNKRTWRPAARARRVARRTRRGRLPRPPRECKATKAASRDAWSGWFIYQCATGILLVPTERCVGPECQGGQRRTASVLGFAGELDAGTRGSFIGVRQAAGLQAPDAFEIARGQNLIEQGRLAGDYSDTYARIAAATLAKAPEKYLAREPNLGEGTSLVRPIAPGAFGRFNYVGAGAAVGPSVTEACACTPREFDAVDIVSGWGIYYVPGGVWMTPSKKCVGGGGRPPGFWSRVWRNVLALEEIQPRPAPPRPIVQAPPQVVAEPAPTPPTLPTPAKGYLCLDPRIWPLAWRPSKTPCEAPAISYPGS